jgi:predicted permease
MYSDQILLEVIAMIMLTLAGYSISRSVLGSRIIRVVNLILFYVSIPLTVLIKVATIPSETVFLSLLIISIVHMLIIYIIAYGVSKAFTANSLDAISTALSLSLPNGLFLAVPLALILFGDVVPVLPYGVATNIVLSLYAIMLARAGSSRGRGGGKLYTRSIPITLSLILGLLLRITMPSLASLEQIKLVSSVITNSFYLSFLIIGESLKTMSRAAIKAYKHLVAISMIVKYLLSPALVIALICVFQVVITIDRLFILGMIIQSIMPPAVVNLIFAKVFDLNYEIISLVLVLLTPISIAMAFVLVGFSS